jgi:hypothetical protein
MPFLLDWRKHRTASAGEQAEESNPKSIPGYGTTAQHFEVKRLQDRFPIQLVSFRSPEQTPTRRPRARLNKLLKQHA